MDFLEAMKATTPHQFDTKLDGLVLGVTPPLVRGDPDNTKGEVSVDAITSKSFEQHLALEPLRGHGGRGWRETEARRVGRARAGQSPDAEAFAMANGQRLAGKPTDAINRALQIDPKHQKALDLAGSAAYQAGDYQKAISYWQQLLKQLPAGSEELRTISDQIAKAKGLAGGKGSR